MCCQWLHRRRPLLAIAAHVLCSLAHFVAAAAAAVVINASAIVAVQTAESVSIAKGSIGEDLRL